MNHSDVKEIRSQLLETGIALLDRVDQLDRRAIQAPTIGVHDLGTILSSLAMLHTSTAAILRCISEGVHNPEQPSDTTED